MKRFLVIIIACSVLIAGCGSSEKAVQTAIAKTALAQPTATNTPIPTTTPTMMPSPTLTATLVPTRVPAFNSTFEEMRANAESWTNAEFKYAYDANGLKAYEGIDAFSGLYVYLLESEGTAYGFMLSILTDPMFDSKKSVKIVFQFMETYVSAGSTTWITENWPEDVGGSNKKQFSTDTGEIIVVIKRQKVNNITILAIDRDYAE